MGLWKLSYLTCGLNPLHRISAKTLESLQLPRVTILLKTSTMLVKLCDGTCGTRADTRQTHASPRSDLFPVKRYKLIHTLIQRGMIIRE